MKSATGISPTVRSHALTFDDVRRLVGLVGGPICAIMVYMLPIDGLSSEAHTLLSIMSLVCLWWITEPVPIPVTSLLGPLLCVVTGVASMGQAFAAFANPIIFLFLGGFVLAKAMTMHSLDRRFAYRVLSLKIVGGRPTRIFIAIGIVTMLCSGWMSNTATAAMMLPIALGLLEAIQDMMKANGKEIDLKNYKFATGLMLMTAYSASIGGVLTPIGTPPNLIMIGFLDSMVDIHISFFQWMIWGGIAMVVYFIIALIVLRIQFKPDVDYIVGAEEIIAKKRAELGPWTMAQRLTLGVFILAVVLWVIPGGLSIAMGPQSDMLAIYNAVMPESAVALLVAILLFFMPIKGNGPGKKPECAMNWKDAAEGIDWGTLLLFGGGLSMGGLMFSTGLSEWVGAAIVSLLGGNPSELAFTAVFCILALGLSELASHTAATNMIGPLAVTAAVSAGFDPVVVSVGIALSASLGFMLPVSTPPNAIVYGSGFVPITKMIKSGFIIDVIGLFCVTIPLVMFVVSAIV